MAKVKTKSISWKGIAQVLRRFPRSGKLLLLTLLLGLWVLLMSLLPSLQSFEGSLRVQQIGFTSDQADELLLRNVRIQKISVSGIQPELTLPGPVQSQNDSSLRSLPELKVQLPDRNSRWTVEPVDLTNTNLRLVRLDLQRHTRVEELSYDASDQTLSFILRPDAPSGTAPPDPLAQLSLESGASPLKITLRQYQLLNNDLPPDHQTRSFILQNPPQFPLPITQKSRLTVQLQQADAQPFWSDIRVRQVDFTKILQDTGDAANNVFESTIASGKVRLAERQLDIEDSQFLLIDEDFETLPGIQTLRRLRVVTTQPAQKPKPNAPENSAKPEAFNGFQVDISGRAHKLEVGLNPKLPVSKIQPTLAEAILPKDLAIAFIGFCSGLFIFLIERLLEDQSE